MWSVMQRTQLKTSLNERILPTMSPSAKEIVIPFLASPTQKQENNFHQNPKWLPFLAIYLTLPLLKLKKRLNHSLNICLSTPSFTKSFVRWIVQKALTSPAAPSLMPFVHFQNGLWPWKRGWESPFQYIVYSPWSHNLAGIFADERHPIWTPDVLFENCY